MDSLSVRATVLRTKTKQLEGCNAVQLMSRSAEVLSAVRELVDVVVILSSEYERLSDEVKKWRQLNASQ